MEGVGILFFCIVVGVGDGEECVEFFVLSIGDLESVVWLDVFGLCVRVDLSGDCVVEVGFIEGFCGEEFDGVGEVVFVL